MPSTLVKASSTFLVLSPLGSFSNQHNATRKRSSTACDLPKGLEREHYPFGARNIFIEKPRPPRREQSCKEQQSCEESFRQLRNLRTNCGGLDRPETAELPRSRRPRRRPLDHDALNLVDGDCVRRPVVELRRLRRRVPGDLLRVLERPSVRQIRRDPRRPERVAADRRRQPRARRPALDHGQHGAAPQRPPRQPAGPGRRSQTRAPSGRRGRRR